MSAETIEDTGHKDGSLGNNNAELNGVGLSGTDSTSISHYSDNQSDPCSSDSEKGGSESVTPADVNDTETVVFPCQVYSAYNSFTAYCESVDSVLPGHAMIYEFEIPQTIVGRLIGKYGSFVNKIKLTTGANIIVKRHGVHPSMKICAVEGLSFNSYLAD